MPPCILRHKVAPQNKITAARFPPALKAGGEKEIENSICVATHHFILKAKHNTFLLLSFGTGFRNLFFTPSLTHLKTDNEVQHLLGSLYISIW